MEQEHEDVWRWVVLAVVAVVFFAPALPVVAALYILTKRCGWRIGAVACAALGVAGLVVVYGAGGPGHWLMTYTGGLGRAAVALYRGQTAGVPWGALLGSAVALSPLPGAGAVFAATRHGRIGSGIGFGKRERREQPERDKVTEKKLVKLAAAEHTTDGVIMGVSQKTGRNVTLGDKELNQNCFVVGTTGSGKTTTLTNIIESAIQRQKPLIVVDGKGDSVLADQIRRLAEQHGRNFYLFSLDDVSSCRWNPLARGRATELTDKLVHLTAWSEEHYLYEAKRFLQAVFGLFEILGVKPDLVSVSKYLYPKEAVELAQKVRDVKLKEKLVTELSSGVTVGGLRNRIAALSASEIGYLFQADEEGFPEETDGTDDVGELLDLAEVENEEPEVAEQSKPAVDIPRPVTPVMDLDSAIQEGAVVLFSLNSLKFKEFSQLIGRLVINDLKTVISRRYSSSSDRDYLYVILDEFAVFASLQSVDVLAQARGAGVCSIIATQSLSDLDIVDRNLEGRIVDNSNTFIIQRANSAENAERLATLAGTVEAFAKTYQTDGLLLTSGTGRGSWRETREFISHPDEIKQLRTGEAVLVRKASGRHEVDRIWVRKPGTPGNNTS
jgi:energy-coupling factor transporter ATP-binding protein EcfA2